MLLLIFISLREAVIFFILTFTRLSPDECVLSPDFSIVQLFEFIGELFEKQKILRAWFLEDNWESWETKKVNHESFAAMLV